MPRGHADRTLAAWNELATLLSADQSNELARQIPGSCTQCHVLGAAESSLQPAEFSAWMAYSKPPMERTLTKFDHTPHLTLPALADCRYCHQLKKGSAPIAQSNALGGSEWRLVNFEGFQAEPATGSARVTECEFRSLSIDQCVACHRPNAASITCTQCHNYHVTTPHGVSQQPLVP